MLNTVDEVINSAAGKGATLQKFFGQKALGNIDWTEGILGVQRKSLDDIDPEKVTKAAPASKGCFTAGSSRSHDGLPSRSQWKPSSMNPDPRSATTGISRSLKAAIETSSVKPLIL